MSTYDAWRNVSHKVLLLFIKFVGWMSLIWILKSELNFGVVPKFEVKTSKDID